MGLHATLAALALALVPLPALATPEVPRHASPCIDGMAEGHARRGGHAAVLPPTYP